VLAENDGLKAIIRIKTPANLAEADWLQIEILNSGPPGRIKQADLQGPSKRAGSSFSSNDLYGVTFGTWTTRNDLNIYSVGNTLPAGRYTTSTPGAFASTHYGLPKSNTDYTMNVTLKLELEDGRSLTMQKPGVPLSFTWTRPAAGQIQTLQKQAEDLLAKAMISATALSASELSVFRTMLMTEETSRTITRDKALAALKQRQIEGTSRFEEVMALVYSKWNTDPVVVAFYLDALRTRGPEALSDLTRFSVTAWDNSFLEPVVHLIEDSASTPLKSMTLVNGVRFLNANYPKWSKDLSVPPRLSRAVREIHFAMENQSGSPGAFYNFMDLLVMTHDRAMIWYLRPYLHDRTIDPFTSRSSSMPSGVTPMRYSELAANAISRLLGEPEIFNSWQRAKVSSPGPYPEWAEWDRKIAVFQQRLDAMPQQ